MRRAGFSERLMAFRTALVRPVVARPPGSVQTSRESGRRRRTRKIFVVKQKRRLLAENRAHRKIEQVLVFDDHPESLRLAFREIRNSHVDLPRAHRATSFDLIVVSILTLLVLVGMFWPLL